MGTIAAFLWVAGVFDWRGSDGRTKLEFIFQCDGKGGTSEQDNCWKSLDTTNKFDVSLDLEPRNGQRDTLEINLGLATPIEKKLIPVLAKGVGLQIISNRQFNVSPQGQASHYYDGNWYSTLPHPAMPVTLAFVGRDLIRYTALSEREVTISMNFARGGIVLYGNRALSLLVFSPNGFDVVEASSSVERDSSGRHWTMRFTGDSGGFDFRPRMRNFDAARLDHILDSSIAALLGVAAGGVMTAFLSLALLRRRRNRGKKRAPDNPPTLSLD